MKSKLYSFLTGFHKNARGERALMESGEDPESRIKNPLQRAAAKLIAGFFALMLAFTVVSRAAEGMTIALVRAETPKSGTINQRIELNGVIKPLEDIEILLPGNLYVTNVKVEAGQKVTQGDMLLEFDLEDVETQLGEQRNSLAIAEARLAIAENGSAPSDNSAVATAELNLKQARDDYDRLKEKTDRSASRAQEDYLSAETELSDARAKYSEALTKAKADMVDAAKTKLDNAGKSLDETKSAAAETIDNAKYSYEQAKANAEKSIANAIKSAETALESAKASASESVASAQYSYDSAVARPGTELEIQRALEQLESAKSKGEKQIADAQAALDEARAAALPADVSRAYDTWQSTIAKQNAKIADAQAANNDARTDYNNALSGKNAEEQQAVVSAQNSVKSAEKALSNAKRSLDDNGQSVDDQLLSSARSVASAQRSLDQALRDAAEKERTGKNSALQSDIEIMTQRAQVASLKKTVKTLEEIFGMEGLLLSPIDGTVQDIAKTGKTQDRAAVATLSRNDMGFQFEAKTDSITAESLSFGDSGQFSYREDGVSQRAQASVTDIGAADENGNCLIIAALPQGSYPSGGNGTLTIRRSGERQNTCIPVSALRSDNDGDYVFVLKEKKTVTGLEYTAARMDVTVLDRDSSLVSVQSGLSRDDKIVTSASKPITEGDRVRLES
ncbi:MAG: hypothetical protein FWF05_07985 [Oscillospiraceae bacterium]|nr:hypothetical protein [Oscillospiraceae bacterium]